MGGGVQGPGKDVEILEDISSGEGSPHHKVPHSIPL